MFTRRPFNKNERPQRAFPGQPLGGRPRLALMEANRLMEAGQYAQAAEIFERLAQGARERGMTERLPMLLLQAARGRILNGEMERGKPMLMEGLQLLYKNRRWRALRRFGEAASAELERLGQPMTAGEVRSWLESALKEAPAALFAQPTPGAPGRQVAAVGRGLLPPRCPNCGANLRSDEVEWIDENYAECPYCGSSVPLGNS